MSLFAELRRRNVLKVGAAYLIAAWLLIQVAATLAPQLHLPEWAPRLITLLLMLGFPIALLIAWFLEHTPEGLKVEPAATGNKRMVVVAVALAALALGWFLRESRPPEKGTEGIKAASTAAAPPEPAEAALIPSVPFSSIAVLPFANLSPDPENEYFADGISEELLNVLSRIDGLKVASRTSAFSFKGRNVPIGEVARTLQVAHVLEGSVRKQGARVRITAQLIDAATDQHLWSDSYDRELTDIFALQDEIARAIATALGGALQLDPAGAGGDAKPPTADLVAYEKFLHGRTLFHQRGQALVEARALLEDAVARDAGFAQAWAVLSAVHSVSPGYGLARRTDSDVLARSAAERARTLDDSLALPHAVLGVIAFESGRPLEALELHDRAVERAASDSTPHLWRGLARLSVGHLASAESDLRRALEIDPLSGINHGWLGAVRAIRGDRTEADRLLARGDESSWPGAGFLLAAHAFADGDRTLAARHLDRYFARMSTQSRETRTTIDAAIAAVTDPARAADFVAAVRVHPASNDLRMLAMLGLHDEAIALALERTEFPEGNFYRTIRMPALRGVYTRPGFYQLAERDGLHAFWQAKGYPDGCRLVESPQRHLDCETPTR